MTKEDSYEYLDRNLREYKLRTAYGGLIKTSRQKASNRNRVQVAHADGCCTSKKDRHVHFEPADSQPLTPRYAAHEKSHSKFDTSAPSYHQHGRIQKTYNRTNKSNQQQNRRHQNQSPRLTTNEQQSNYNYNSRSTQSTVPTAKKKDGGGCCCTIL